MTSISLTRNMRVVAEEIARIAAESCPSISLTGDRLSFDAEDAADLAAIAGDADVYYRRIRKMALSAAAAYLAQAMREVSINERYLTGRGR